MLTLLLFAFVSGLVTVLAPCIWPLLPIILSATATGGRRKPLGITLGLAVSFFLATLFLSYLLQIIPISPDALRFVAVGIIGALGVALLWPRCGAWIETQVSRLVGRFGTGAGERTGFGGGLLVGLSLGLVWTPCAGPILAAVATLAATQALNFQVVLVALFFTLGISIPLFVFALLGQRLIAGNRRLSPYLGRIQQAFGVVMILTALAIATQYDKKLQSGFLDLVPGYAAFINRLEDRPGVRVQLDSLRGGETSFRSAPGLDRLGAAPEIQGIESWINSEPLTLASLRGKVVLVDFWTYSCINCIRTFPHVKGWYEKYRDQGFIVIGVHAPEFQFEKDRDNVVAAAERYGLTYPIAQDNAFATWTAYRNRYWPAHYLIDAEGQVRRTHFGEGEYEETEAAIQALLKEAGAAVADVRPAEMPDETPRLPQTPETYLGLARMEHFTSPERPEAGTKTYSFPASLKRDTFAYAGEWTLDGEKAVAGREARLRLRYRGPKVFLVVTPDGNTSSVLTLSLDGRPLDQESAGQDARDGRVTIDGARLFHLVDRPGDTAEHTLEISVDSGLAVHAFTFGS